VSSSSKYTA